jgi:hypothetical protein
MTKTEQNRVVALRLKHLRQADELTGASLRPAGISAFPATPSIDGELGSKVTVRSVCVIVPNRLFMPEGNVSHGHLQAPAFAGAIPVWSGSDRELAASLSPH